MKNKIKTWIRRLVLWAMGDYFEAETKEFVSRLKMEMHHARDHLAAENKRHWQMLNSKISALQAIDAGVSGDPGKIVIVAKVRGQDIVKILDIPSGMSLDEHRRMIHELQERYGARPEYIDAPSSYRPFLDGGATARAVRRDRGEW